MDWRISVPVAFLGIKIVDLDKNSGFGLKLHLVGTMYGFIGSLYISCYCKIKNGIFKDNF